MRWFQFHDMHSGGDRKTDFSHLFIEAASQEEAESIFTARFGRDPHYVTCDCCGADYSIGDYVSLQQATGYERGCLPLKTPRDAKGYRRVDDQWFHDNYWTEPGQEIKPPYEIEERWYGGHVPLDEYVKRADVFVLSAEQRAKDAQ